MLELCWELVLLVLGVSRQENRNGRRAVLSVDAGDEAVEVFHVAGCAQSSVSFTYRHNYILQSEKMAGLTYYEGKTLPHQHLSQSNEQLQHSLPTTISLALALFSCKISCRTLKSSC